MLSESPSILNKPLRVAHEKELTIFDQLLQLAEEMRAGIYNLSSEPQDIVREDLERIKTASECGKAPEMALVVSLFRKYADTAHRIKDDCKESMDKMGFIGDLPVLYEFKEENELAGWAALKTNVFWVRVIVSLLSFLSFVVMSSVEYISYPYFNPSWTFEVDCELYRGRYFSGFFDFWPYQLVLALGVILYVYSSLVAIYYLLPVDEQRRKTIPGLTNCLGACIRDPYRAQETAFRVRNLLSLFSKMLQLALDATLLLITLTAAVTASIYLEASVPFGVPQVSVALYFTMGSFYSTFLRTVSIPA
jgi:hypothetical protein